MAKEIWQLAFTPWNSEIRSHWWAAIRWTGRSANGWSGDGGVKLVYSEWPFAFRTLHPVCDVILSQSLNNSEPQSPHAWKKQGRLTKIVYENMSQILSTFINEERKGSLLAWGLGQIIRSWARTDGRGGRSSGMGPVKQVDQVPAPSHMAAGHCMEMWEQNGTPR